jgi:hypothetical protein
MADKHFGINIVGGTCIFSPPEESFDDLELRPKAAGVIVLTHEFGGILLFLCERQYTV